MKDKFYTADIETRGELGKFILGGIYDGRKYWEFENEKDFIHFLLQKKGLIFFHYLDYDIRYILDWCQKKKIRFENLPTLINGKVIEWKFNKDLIFRDSFVLTQSSLKELAESFNLKIKKLEIKDYLSLRRTKYLRQYLKNDVIALYQILKKFYDFLGIDYLKKRTLSAIAMEKFKKIDGLSYFKITGYSVSDWAEKFIREGFFSSYYYVFRREFESSKKTILKIDCNSFYGAMMRDNLFPYGLYFYIKNPKEISKNLREGKLGLIKAKMILKKSLPLGVLPVRTEKEVIYPKKGTFLGVWTSPEIEFAQSKGYQFRFKEAVFWEYKDYLFKKFINHLAKIRESSKGARSQIVKFLLVSFYGKFAQRREIEKMVKLKEPEVNRFYFDKDLTLSSEKKYIYAPYSHPEISAFTTAYARIFLWRLCEELGWKKVYAILQDALICEEPDLEFQKKWFDPIKIGKFKVDCIIKKGIILGRGIYALKDIKGQEIIRNQGGVKEFNKLLTFKDFEKAKKKDFWLQYDKNSGIKRPKTISTILKNQGKFKEMRLVQRKIKIKT